ncbi:MAG: DUF1294 domain-containing protein [Bacilli bacterium]
MPSGALFPAYLAVVNAAALLMMFSDKRRSRRRRKRRVRERTLLALTVLGGALGAWIGMAAFHHKTKHTSFRVLAPVCTAVWTILILWLMYRGVRI